MLRGSAWLQTAAHCKIVPDALAGKPELSHWHTSPRETACYNRLNLPLDLYHRACGNDSPELVMSSFVQASLLA